MAGKAMLVVLESYLRRVTNSRDHTDIVIAAGIALEDLGDLCGQCVGKNGASLPAQR